MYNISMESAGYRVIEDIRDYNNLGGMKKQQSDLAMRIYALNQVSGRQNNAIMALFKLESLGITAIGIIIVGIANEISATQPTYGVASHSLILLSSYLFCIG